MRKQETILFVMPRLPFPTTSGRKMSLYHYCRILSEELGYRLVVAAFLENGDEVKEDRKSTRLNSSHVKRSRMPSSA